MKKITTISNFIKKCKIIHNNKYDYSLIIPNNSIKVDIICPEHGIFKQKPYHHSNGHGCPSCSKNKKFNTKQFIELSKKTHNNKYDYSLVEYKNMHTKVKIICNNHGIFEQNTQTHINGAICPKCENDKFVRIAKKIHNNRYDYSLVEYIKASIKVKIKCKIHGIFEQTPNNHITKKHNCPKCGNISRRISRINQISKDKFNGNQIIPSYNQIGCELFDKISKENNIHIQHAMNGGEFYIKELGYWIDGYDKVNNVVYEYDEKHHYINNKLSEKDIIRQKEIEEHLSCKFIRFKE